MALTKLNKVGIEGTVDVPHGGTGVGTITGLVKGSGVGGFSAAVSGTDIKTVNGTTMLGSGDIATFTATGSDAQLTRQMLIDCGYTKIDKGNSGTGTVTLDYTTGNMQKITNTGAHTIATSNWPPTGNLGEMMLELVNGAAFTITWPAINWIKGDGTVTTTFSQNGVTLQTSGTDFCVLWSSDGGTTIYGKWIR